MTRPSPDWAEYGLYADLDTGDRSCQHLPEMCSGESSRWDYDAYCDFTSYLRWLQPEPPSAFWQKYDAAANRCES